jgi:enoyl-CoA hydratase
VKAADPILLKITDGIARLTLNRPARRNALDITAMRTLGDHVDATRRRDDVRCLVLTGSGGAFCSGADLPNAGASFPQRAENLEMMGAAGRVATGLTQAPFPVIAEVEGPAAGVGASMAFACDLVIASRSAFFLLPFVGIGLVPDGGATLTVAASIGRARAMHMALLQERFTASMAFDAGLIAMVCEPEELDRRTAAIAHGLATGPARALARTKAAINAHTIGALELALTRETEEQLPLLETWEFREGVSAFRERRRPDYSTPIGTDASISSERSALP